MTEAQDTTKAEAAKLDKLAAAYLKDRTREPGYSYRLKVVGGQTVAVVKKIGKS